MANIAARVRHVIHRHLDVDESRVRTSASFVDDLGADSVGLVELTLALEEEFEIDIEDEDAERMRTVQDAIEYVERRASERALRERSS